MTPSSWYPPTVVLIGTGISSEISYEVKAWLERAEVVVCSEDFSKKVNPKVEKVLIKAPVSRVIEKIKKESLNKKILVVASGDPLFHGIGRTLTEALSKENLYIVPSITSVQYLFSKIKLPWDDAITFSLHKENTREFFYWLRLGKKIALLTSPERGPSFIGKLLAEHFPQDSIEMVVGEKLGTSQERITYLFPKEAVSKQFENPNVAVLLPKKSFIKNNPFFDEEYFFHEKGMITKKEIRALVISSLELLPGDTLWDIGAGSGSVSIEASYKAPLKAVFAVEKNEKRIKHLKENIKNFHCGEIFICQGDALELSKNLPKPDKIFIGGAGKDLKRLLEIIHERFQNSFPTTVINTVLWHSLGEIQSFASGFGLQAFIVQAQISRAVSLSSSFRFEALNPVFITILKSSTT